MESIVMSEDRRTIRGRLLSRTTTTRGITDSDQKAKIKTRNGHRNGFCVAAARPLPARAGGRLGRSRPEQPTGPRAGRALVLQADMSAVVVRLPEFHRVSGQRVQGPAGGDHVRVRVDFGLRPAEGLLEFGWIAEQLALAADHCGSP